MDCRQCNWYLCDTCHPLDPGSSSLWGAISTLTDQMATPAVQSALDSVALRVGDVIDAATQDMTEMATEVKTFVSSSLGLQDSDDEGPRPQERPRKHKELEVSPRQRAESVQLVADFCEKYPAARVIPNEDELENLWARCSILQTTPVANALYDQLTWSGGDSTWQSRLRVLYALEHFHYKGGIGKEITNNVMQNATGLVQHLTEVQQCREKAQQVLQVLLGKGTDGQPSAKNDKKTANSGHAADDEADGKRKTAQPKAKVKAKAPAKAAAKAPPDLFDAVAPTSAAAPAAVAKAGGPVDLLSLPDPAPVVDGLQDLNLLGDSMPAVVMPTLDLRPDATVATRSAGPDLLLSGTTSSSSTTAAPAGQEFDPNKLARSGLAATALGGAYGVPAAMPGTLGATPPSFGAFPSGGPGNPLGPSSGGSAPGQPRPGQGSSLGFAALGKPGPMGQPASAFGGFAAAGHPHGRAPAPASSTESMFAGLGPVLGSPMGSPPMGKAASGFSPMGKAAGGFKKPAFPMPSDAAASLPGGPDPFSFVAAHTGIASEKK